VQSQAIDFRERWLFDYTQAIQKNLPIFQVFREKNNQRRSLNDFQKSATEEKAEGETFGARAVITQVLIALLIERFCPSLDVSRFELTKTATGAGHGPHSREVRFAIRCSWRRRSEVGSVTGSLEQILPLRTGMFRRSW